MKMRWLIALLILSCGGGQEQPATFTFEDDGQWQKASTTHRLSPFPKIHPDGSVWFQFKAPQTAQSVQVRVGAANRIHDMQKDANGLWNLVIPNPGPGFQVYWMIVDSMVVADPGSDMFYQNAYRSVVEVPAPGEDYYTAKQLPHGDVREHWFYSTVTGSFRRMFVYTPPGYDKDANTQYPVLYLQHGAGEAEPEWTHSGRANFILDNLIAEGKARPMIIVMNNGFATRPEQAGETLTGNARWAAFEDMLITEVIPDIDASYRTIPDRAHRAMAGLSMGGMQTFTIGLSRLDTFSHLGIFSGVPTNYADLLKDAVAQGSPFNQRLDLLWFGAGTDETQFHDRQKEVQDLLGKSGIDAKYYISNGTAHEWQTWRRCLNQYAQLLFQE